MSKEDSHSTSFNLPSSIGSTTRILILIPNDYEVWVYTLWTMILALKHMLQVSGMLYQRNITGIRRQNKFSKLQRRLDEIVAHDKELHSDEKHKLIKNLKASRILMFSLPTDIFCFVSSYETAKENWVKFKELYSGDVDLKCSIQTELLCEFGAFEQNVDETLD